MLTWFCFGHRINFHSIKIEFPKIKNFLDTTSNDKDLPRFVTKNVIEFYGQ